MSVIVAVSTIVGVGITVLATLLGAIVRITRSWSRLEARVEQAVSELGRHITDEREADTAWRTTAVDRMVRTEDRVSRAEHQLAVLSARGGRARTT